MIMLVIKDYYKRKYMIEEEIIKVTTVLIVLFIKVDL